MRILNALTRPATEPIETVGCPQLDLADDFLSGTDSFHFPWIRFAVGLQVASRGQRFNSSKKSVNLSRRSAKLETNRSITNRTSPRDSVFIGNGLWLHSADAYAVK